MVCSLLPHPLRAPAPLLRPRGRPARASAQAAASPATVFQHQALRLLPTGALPTGDPRPTVLSSTVVLLQKSCEPHLMEPRPWGFSLSVASPSGVSQVVVALGRGRAPAEAMLCGATSRLPGRRARGRKSKKEKMKRADA